MTDERTEPEVDPEADARRWVLYEKDPATKIATITLNRPEQLNAPTIAMISVRTPKITMPIAGLSTLRISLIA